jgi:VanZ family protein
LWAPVVVYMSAIFALSAISEPPSPPGLDDKAQHALAYSGLALVTLRATSGATIAGLSGRAAIAAWAIATGYGVTDELHQAFVPGRTPDLLDVRADAVGAGGAALAGWAFGIIVRSRRHHGAFQDRQ